MENIKKLKGKLRRAIERAYDDATSTSEVIELWKQDKRRKIPNHAKRLFCSGCRMNYYNSTEPDGCWYLDKAKLKKMKIYRSLDSIEANDVITLSCYIKDYKR